MKENFFTISLRYAMNYPTWTRLIEVDFLGITNSAMCCQTQHWIRGLIIYYEAWYASFEGKKYISVEIRLFLVGNLVL